MRKSLGLWTSLTLLFVAAPIASGAHLRGTVIQDFETGTVVLDSYPDQDQEPNDWEVTADNTYAGTAYALRIYGNSWKTQEISPYDIADTTVWQVAVYAERLGEMQAFGISDGVNELLYTFAGEQLPEGESWWTVYQGAFPLQEWYAYLLPIGEDWAATYGYAPTVVRLIYVNDDDQGGHGITLFDEIIDVTEDLPVAPQARILHNVESTKRVAKNLYRVGVQFYGTVFDPDSDEHVFRWDFGDSTFSEEENPFHEFVAEADYFFTVSLVVRDDDGLAGNDTCQVRVEPGEGGLPFTMNFVGDIMIARSYEAPGGIIDTYGLEAIFAPTLPILGDAADVSVCNLECPFTDRGEPHPTKSVVFRARPENIVGVRDAGIDVVDIGNNHIIDYGEEGMLQTQQLLDSLEIRYSGAGTNAYFALQPAFRTEAGVRVAFLGMSNRTGRQWNYQPFLDAGYNKPGFAYLLSKNVEKALDDTGDLADIVILQFHSGDEYETEPPPRGWPAGEPDSGDRWRIAPPPVEAAEISPDDPDFRFRVEPSPGDRELRRMALDLGADVVINHHPHVLQGFEAHDGKLIAHSLGNFIFDLSYPETMPTIVLTLEMDKDGIAGYFFVPAWIDDYITRPANGQLGREIMDRMADYSRPMNALVAVDPEGNLARVFLSRDEADSSVTRSIAEAPLADEDGYRISPPIALSGAGNLAGIISVTGDEPASWEISWGREILWHGGFEDEGATFWDVNTDDEWLDETEFHTGARSLALRRHENDSGPVGTDLERHLPCDPGRRHSAAGYLKADNAADAVTMARFYSSRTASNPISSTDLAPPYTGSLDWTAQWRNLETPENGVYFELRCSNDAPASGTGHAWFDDLSFIEWEEWVPGDTPISIPSPNNYRFLQVRCSNPSALSVTVEYEETAYATAPVSVAASSAPAHPGSWLTSAPNPFGLETRIALRLPPSATRLPAMLAVYDVRGRLVTTLFRGLLPAGHRQTFTWDGTDRLGRLVPSGVYFSRAVVGSETETRKLLLLR